MNHEAPLSPGHYIPHLHARVLLQPPDRLPHAPLLARREEARDVDDLRHRRVGRGQQLGPVHARDARGGGGACAGNACAQRVRKK